MGDGFERLGRRLGVLDAVEVDLVDVVGMVALYEVVLEREPAIVGPQLGAHDVVGHRQQLGVDAQGERELGLDLGQPDASAHPLRAQEVGRDVPVAEAEPRLLPIALEHRSGRPGLVAHPPAGGVVGQAGQRVHDGVEVRADEQAVELEVVAGVDDDGELDIRPWCLCQHGHAVAQLGAAVATGQHDDAPAARSCRCLPRHAPLIRPHSGQRSIVSRS